MTKREHAAQILTSIRYLGERLKLALGPVKRSTLITGMALARESLGELYKRQDEDEVLTSLKEAALLLDAAKSASPSVNPTPMVEMVRGVNNILNKMRKLEAALQDHHSVGSVGYRDLVELGALLAVTSSMIAFVQAELPSDHHHIVETPALLEMCGLGAEIIQGAHLCQDLGARLAATIAARLN